MEVDKFLTSEKAAIEQNNQVYNRPVEQHEVDRGISIPDPFSAPGPDRVLPILLQKSHHNVNKAVHHAINISFDEGVFPETNKRENRTYIAKDNKKHYNQSNS